VIEYPKLPDAPEYRDGLWEYVCLEGGVMRHADAANLH
jgi:hypothetical protein